MNKKWIFRGSLVLVIGLLLSQSVRFEKLDEHNQKMLDQNFDAESFALDFWQNKLPGVVEQAVDAAVFLKALEADLLSALKTHGNTLGIADAYSILLKGSGTVLAVTDDGIAVSVQAPVSQPDIQIETAFIFGNAIRDASGLVDVSDFPNSTDFNNISGILNRTVREEVLPPFLSKVKAGQKIYFAGATEIRTDRPDEQSIKIIPVLIDILEEETNL